MQPDKKHAMKGESPGWQEHRWWGRFLLCLYVVLAFLPIILAHFTRPAGISGFIGFSRALGITGFSILALQVALGSRLKFIDRPWGLDAVMRFHKRAGTAALALLLLHPLALLVAYAYEMELGAGIAFGMLRGIYGGVIALALLLAVVFFALFIRRLGWNYQHWRFKHKFTTMAVVVLGFAHGLREGPAMPGPMRVYFWGLLLAAAGLFLYRNIYVILWGRSRWKVSEVTPETHDTYTLSLQPAEGEPSSYCPGQFVFLRLNRPGRPSEEHPFTLSSSPTSGRPLTVTVKESGDFTDTISQTRPGDEALIDGPFGRFSFQFDSPKSFIFIAGGVGITPLLSMLRHLRDTNDRRRSVLICGNQTEKDIIRRGELKDMPENVTVAHVLNTPPGGWEGYEGYVDRKIIRECAGDLLPEADVYLCGPPPMMDAVTDELKGLNVPRRRIHTERFSL